MAPLSLCILAFLVTVSTAGAVPSMVEQVLPGIYMVHDDQGQWGGMAGGMGITHQNRAEYQARKILDFTDVPEGVWEQVRAARISAYFMVRDYSFASNPPANGLDESYQLVVNGTVHTYPTNGGAPVYAEGKAPTIDWYDFDIPKEELRRGPNEIILRKAPGSKGDDYLYLGIDTSIRRGNSAVSFDGKTWTQEKLTVPGGNGEYMIRAYLLCGEQIVKITWRPGSAPEDPRQFLLYAGAHGATLTDRGVSLAAGQEARLEWSPAAFDLLSPVQVQVDAVGPTEFAWLDAEGKPFAPVRSSGSLTQSLPAGRSTRVSGLVVRAAGAPAEVRRITLQASAGFHPTPKPLDMCPPIAAPAGDASSVAQPPSCALTESEAKLQAGGLVAIFRRGPHLQLASLMNRVTGVEMLSDPAAVSLFLVEVDGRRYGGCQDFTCDTWEPRPSGFRATLSLSQPALTAFLEASATAGGLRLALALRNAGTAPLDFKIAFPHLAGLTASGDPAGDYYFFPSGGGIIADTPALIRRGYGDHEAIYQVMDLFSPSRGGGMWVRTDDAEGWHKVLALRKFVPGRTEFNYEQLGMRVREEYRWSNPLPAMPGISVAYEYLRRTRAPGGEFTPAAAILCAHVGDWHEAMGAYSAWAHQVWKFRPLVTRLRRVHNMIAAGWGTGYLFKDGAYRTDIIKPRTDCIELMSWWDWSPLGPFSTPFDQLDKVLDAATIKRWQGYFVKDPVTGQTMWNNQPGDYDGYNERFGGLPAFRKAIETYRKMGALVTLYTDPFRLDDASKTGRAHGREWGVVGTDGKLTTAYEVWNPCHDLPQVREWVAKTMERVLRETGADGIRLDEYGHCGWACYSTEHKHTFAEYGITQWQKAVADATRQVREAMDRINPNLVLTTEHPGYDYLMQYLDGCITYDLTNMATALRPLECNLQRFYFPECKAYELDHRGVDPNCNKRFWNAVECFGKYYPVAYYTILAQNEGTYQSGVSTPLLLTPAQVPGLYVNRFVGAGKTIYHLYNATGHTFEGTALAIPIPADHHIFDLLNNTEVTPTPPGADGLCRVSCYLPRDGVACFLVVRRQLSVAWDADTLRGTTTAPGAPLTLALCDAAGETLAAAPVMDGTATLSVSALPADRPPATVKLLHDRDLIDICTLPAH
jgi:hypothetical protein